MAKPAAKLARSLEALSTLQERGIVAIRAGDLSRTDRERLLENGFLQEVMKGWYVAIWPDEQAGESTAWFAAFWDFCATYLEERFGTEWCLSPEQSLLLQIGNRTVPEQLLVRSPKANNNVTTLLHGTSVLDSRAALPDKADMMEKDGLRLMRLPAALIAVSPRFFTQYPTDARAALSMIRDASDILDRLLSGGHSVIAGRLAGACRNIGQERVADDILKNMQAAGYDVRETDPFSAPAPVRLGAREHSPYVNRIHLMWQTMRETVLERFPKAPGKINDIETYLAHVDDAYVTDAYHSLSIEGYRVSHDLIERVRSGAWNPDNNEADRQHRDTLAARGYWLAFKSVKTSLEKVLKGENPGTVADQDHGEWYRELFAPSVTAGLLQASSLAGYRNGPVVIRRSMHVPPDQEAVRDMMPALFELLEQETEPAVRVILGHFGFVYIHPYTDGNGRIGRFLMNVMLAAGGYPWTVIPIDERETYMAALEDASVRQTIGPFTDFLAGLVQKQL